MNPSITQLSALKGHQGAIYALEKGPKAGMVYTGGSDKLITSWDLNTYQNLPFLARFPSPIYSICYVPEYNLLISGTSSGAVHLIDLGTNTERKVLRHHTAPVFDIRYSILHQSFYTLAGDGTIALCSLESGSVTKIRKLSDAKLRQMDLNAEETEMVVASGDGDLVFLDTLSFEVKRRFKAHEFSTNSVRYHPSGKMVISGGKDAYMKVWDIEQAFQNIHSVPAHNFAIYKILFSPDSRLFATASRDKTIKIWDAETFALQTRIDKERNAGHVNSVNTLLWSEHPDCLVSAGDDRSVLIWKVQ